MKHPAARQLVVLAVAATVAAGCGGGGSDATPATAVSTATAATTGDSELATTTTISTTGAAQTTTTTIATTTTTTTTIATTTTAATTTTVPETQAPDAALICSLIDAETLNATTLSEVADGVVEEDSCRFDLINAEGALRIEVVETTLEDPIGNFTTLMRLTGDVYTTPLADGGVLGIAQDRDLFVFKDGINLWKVSAPIGAVDREVLSRIGQVMVDTISPRDIDPSEIREPAATAADPDAPTDRFDGQAFCATWDELEASIDRVLEAPDVPAQKTAATEALALFAERQPPKGAVLGFDEYSAALVRFLEGAEIDDLDAMEAAVADLDAAEAQFNIWLATRC